MPVPEPMEHAAWMRRCLQLACNGEGHTAPNPLVGAVLVQGGRVLAEGWHRAYGGPHAEVECLRAFGDGPIPRDAVMYVSLEPCSHAGRTPPCANLLVARQVPTVVVGCPDPNPKVAGRGIALLREAGIQVISPVLEDACRWVNRRFITAMERQRPYIILKWARSIDGFLDRSPRGTRCVQRISSFTTDVLVHRWRSAEAAIMVGSRTVLNDDPRLDVRHVDGPSPLRVVLDRGNVAPPDSHVFRDGGRTLLFTARERHGTDIPQVILAAEADPLPGILEELHKHEIRSLLVEGGGELLGHFIRLGLWDEAREIVGQPHFGQGTPAPRLPHSPVRSVPSGADCILFYTNGTQALDAWPW